MIIGAMPFGCGAAYYVGYVDDRSFRGGARDDPDGEWTDEEREHSETLQEARADMLRVGPVEVWWACDIETKLPRWD